VTRSSLKLAIALAVAPVAEAHADDPPPAYSLRLEVDLPALAISTIATTAWFFDLGPAWCAPQCDASRLNPIDRPFAGRHVPGWTTAGTLTAGVLIAAPPAVLAAFEGPRNAVNDSVVIAESLLFSSGLDAILQTAVRRPRPFLYGTSAPLADREETSASLSFPSGHTALAFAATFATWRTLDRLDVSPCWQWLVLGVGGAGATFVGVSRVISGDHFPTDVLAGAGMGAAFGVLVPALHRRDIRVVPADHAIALTGRW
jgi:membrane-associated phospholipid phosphatase